MEANRFFKPWWSDGSMELAGRILAAMAASFALIALYFLLRDHLNRVFTNLITHSAKQGNIELGLPECELTKSWQQDGAVIATLHVSSSGKDTKQALQGVQTLLQLSKEHDSYCLQTSNNKGGREIG